MYEDDTVICYAHEEKETIEECLSQDCRQISKYLDETELIINLKKGKTESMLFGTARKLNKISEPFIVNYRDSIINETSCYEYLGNEIDPNVNLHKNFEKRYKKATGRLRLLRKVREYLTQDAALKVYNMMIAPLLTYCCLVKLSLNKTQLSKLTDFEAKASHIVYGERNEQKIRSIIRERNVKSCLMVYKCIHDEVCSPMKNYFEIHKHERETRNQNYLVKLPKLRLELGRQAFSYSGAKLYNDLPLDLRKQDNFKDFKNSLRSHHF